MNIHNIPDVSYGLWRNGDTARLIFIRIKRAPLLDRIGYDSLIKSVKNTGGSRQTRLSFAKIFSNLPRVIYVRYKIERQSSVQF